MVAHNKQLQRADTKIGTGRAPNLFVEFPNKTWHKNTFEYAKNENHSQKCDKGLWTELETSRGPS